MGTPDAPPRGDSGRGASSDAGSCLPPPPPAAFAPPLSVEAVGLPRGVVLLAALDLAAFGFSLVVPPLAPPRGEERPPRGEASPPRGVRRPSSDESCLARVLDGPPPLALRALSGRSPSRAETPSAFSGATAALDGFTPSGLSALEDDGPRALRGVFALPLDDAGLASAPPRGVLAFPVGFIRCGRSAARSRSGGRSAGGQARELGKGLPKILLHR